MIGTLANLCNELLLTQLIHKPTHYQGNTLDLVFTNNDSLVHDYEIVPTLHSISHHSMVKVLTQYKAPILPSKEDAHPKLSPMDDLNFHSKDINWESLTSTLENVDWETLLSEKSADEMLDIIYKQALLASTQHVPARDNKKKISKQKKMLANLARRRRRINKQYQRITSPARKTKLYNELIQIEVQLQKIHGESTEYQGKKPVIP